MSNTTKIIAKQLDNWEQLVRQHGLSAASWVVRELEEALSNAESDDDGGVVVIRNNRAYCYFRHNEDPIVQVTDHVVDADNDRVDGVPVDYTPVPEMHPAFGEDERVLLNLARKVGVANAVEWLAVSAAESLAINEEVPDADVDAVRAIQGEYERRRFAKNAAERNGDAEPADDQDDDAEPATLRAVAAAE